MWGFFLGCFFLLARWQKLHFIAGACRITPPKSLPDSPKSTGWNFDLIKAVCRDYVAYWCYVYQPFPHSDLFSIQVPGEQPHRFTHWFIDVQATQWSWGFLTNILSTSDFVRDISSTKLSSVHMGIYMHVWYAHMQISTHLHKAVNKQSLKQKCDAKYCITCTS